MLPAAIIVIEMNVDPFSQLQVNGFGTLLINVDVVIVTAVGVVRAEVANG